MREKETVPLDKSRIAVLPFLNLSAEADNTHLADGMTEELIAQLIDVISQGAALDQGQWAERQEG